MTSAKPLTPDSPVSALPGFGPKRAKAAEKLVLQQNHQEAVQQSVLELCSSHLF